MSQSWSMLLIFWNIQHCLRFSSNCWSLHIVINLLTEPSNLRAILSFVVNEHCAFNWLRLRNLRLVIDSSPVNCLGLNLTLDCSLLQHCRSTCSGGLIWLALSKLQFRDSKPYAFLGRHLVIELNALDCVGLPNPSTISLNLHRIIVHHGWLRIILVLWVYSSVHNRSRNSLCKCLTGDFLRWHVKFWNFMFWKDHLFTSFYRFDKVVNFHFWLLSGLKRRELRRLFFEF